MTGAITIEVLSSAHDRTGFSCGVEALDRYFRSQVTQDVRRRATACYVARDITAERIAGYYTLSASSIPLSELPGELARRFPRYPIVPVALLGRLAVEKSWQGRHLGGALVWDAVLRARRSEVAVFALVVDAKDDDAETFYRHHGFTAFGSLPRHLILSLASPGPR